MKKTFLAFALALSSLCALSAAPRYYTWVNYSEARDWDKYCAELADVGLNGIILSASVQDIAKVAPIAKKHGIALHAWMWITNNGSIAAEHPEWLDYNAKGESLKDKKAYVDYYKFLSPIIPGVRDAIVAQVEKMAAVDGVESISLDYCRYVDAILPSGLWKNYGIVQDKVYPQWDYGYHPEMIAAFEAKYGYNPQKLADPTKDEKWLQFRLDAVNELVGMIKKAISAHGVKLSASPFPTPEMSRGMVYQDWGAWPLDIAFPMIYHGFYGGGLDWVTKCVKDCRAQMNPNGELCLGTFVGDFKNSDFTLEQAIGAALDNGATGFSLFTFDGLSAPQKATLKAYLKTSAK